MTHSLAFKACFWKTPPGQFDVLGTQIESQIVARWKVAHDGPGPAADFKNSRTGAWLNILVDQNFGDGRSAHHVPPQLVSGRNGQNAAKILSHSTIVSCLCVANQRQGSRCSMAGTRDARSNCLSIMCSFHCRNRALSRKFQSRETVAVPKIVDFIKAPERSHIFSSNLGRRANYLEFATKAFMKSGACQ